MVSGLSIAFMAVSLLISVLLPIFLTVYFYRKYRIFIGAVFVGALMFFLFQMVIRIPLLNFLPRYEWYINLMSTSIAAGIFLGLTAGIFETAGRFLGLKFILKNKQKWENGVAYGIGHGGFEAIVLIGLSSLSNIANSMLINSGVFDSIVGAQIPQETVQALKDGLISTPPFLFLMGGLERVLVIPIHIALSLIVLYGIIKGRHVYLLYAVLLHALLDAPVSILSMYGVSIWLIELYVALFTVAALIYIVKSKEQFTVAEVSEATEKVEDGIEG